MQAEPREVVVTGMGLVSPLGIGVNVNWEGIAALRTGIARVPREGVPPFLQFMGRVPDLDIDRHIPPKQTGQKKFLNRGSLLGFAAAHEAVERSDIDLACVEPGRRALYVASGDTTKVGYDFVYPAMKDATRHGWQSIDFEKLNRSTLDKVNPFFLLESIMNNLFSFLSAVFEFMGSNATLASHSPCGGNAIELAYRSIRDGQADLAIAVGCGNWITEIPMYELEGLGVLSKCRDGAQSYRPFDRRRDGFIPGEGGAALLLETADAAEKRGADILARLRGIGNHLEPPGGAGLGVPTKVTARSMQSALDDASCEVTDLAFLCPHGSGSLKGDRSELQSIGELCGTKVRDIPVCGLKPYTGHLGAASDIAEVILGIRAVRERMVPATLNFGQSEGQFRDYCISPAHRGCDRDSFLSVSYGIGGQSSSVVVRAV